jgi:hypothetical protein
MKANAPEKIYVDSKAIGDDISTTVHTKRQDYPTCIEYTRTDAFIEKACSWLKNHYRDYMYNPTGKRLEAFFGGDMCNDFEDYVKGE